MSWMWILGHHSMRPMHRSWQNGTAAFEGAGFDELGGPVPLSSLAVQYPILLSTQPEGSRWVLLVVPSLLSARADLDWTGLAPMVTLEALSEEGGETHS